jgi:sugar lactone lactonase YvrE
VALVGATPVAGAAPRKAAAEPAPSGARIDTTAGRGETGYSGDGGPARSAMLNEPRSVAVDGAGIVYLADSLNHCVRRVDLEGRITTLAGTGVAGYSGDGGPAASAQLDWPQGVAVEQTGRYLFIADTSNHRIRLVDLTTGMISTAAGTGVSGFSGDGAVATGAALNAPKGVLTGPDGTWWIADSGNDRVRQVSPSAVIVTIAGTGAAGFSGDGGQATLAQFDGPRGLARDAAGNLYIADDNNDRVRRVGPDGVVATVAGNGTTGFAGDGGPATGAALARPRDLVVTSAGDLYIADSANNRIRHVSPAGVIGTISGTGRASYGGDGGPAAKASLFLPRGLGLAPNGDLYVADTYNDRVRRITAG